MVVAGGLTSSVTFSRACRIACWSRDHARATSSFISTPTSSLLADDRSSRKSLSMMSRFVFSSGAASSNADISSRCAMYASLELSVESDGARTRVRLSREEWMDSCNLAASCSTSAGVGKDAVASSIAANCWEAADAIRPCSCRRLVRVPCADVFRDSSDHQ